MVIKISLDKHLCSFFLLVYAVLSIGILFRYINMERKLLIRKSALDENIG